MEEQRLKGLISARRMYGECDADLEDFVARCQAHFSELDVPFLVIGPDVAEEEVAEIVAHAGHAAAAVGADLSIAYSGATICGPENVLLPAEFDVRRIDSAAALHVYTQRGAGCTPVAGACRVW